MQEAAVKTALDVIGAAPIPKRRYVHAIVKVTAGEPHVGMKLLSLDTPGGWRVAGFTFSSLDLLEQGKLPLVLEPLEAGYELQAGMHLIEAGEGEQSVGENKIERFSSHPDRQRRCSKGIMPHVAGRTG